MRWVLSEQVGGQNERLLRTPDNRNNRPPQKGKCLAHSQPRRKTMQNLTLLIIIIGSIIIGLVIGIRMRNKRK